MTPRDNTECSANISESENWVKELAHVQIQVLVIVNSVPLYKEYNVYALPYKRRKYNTI